MKMKIIEVLKFNRELIKRLRMAGIRLEDEQFVDLYSDYTTLLAKGERCHTSWLSFQKGMP